MNGSTVKRDRISPLEKLLEVIGVKQARKKLDQLMKALVVDPASMNQGAFDIQAMYSEIDHALLDMGGRQLKRAISDLLRELISTIHLDDIKKVLKRLNLKEGLEQLDKTTEIIHINEQYQKIKQAMEEMGIKNTTIELKRILEESVIQERVEDFKSYLIKLGVENPDTVLEELIEAAGFGDVFKEIKNLLGWNEIIPL